MRWWWSDQVYAILGSHGLVKVGFSRDPARRIRDLQTGSPFRLGLAFATETYGRGEEVEREVHAILARHRKDGEWFAVPVEVAVAAISAAAYRVREEATAPRPPRWWLRYAVLTAILAPAFAQPTPALFIFVSAAIIFWTCLALARRGRRSLDVRALLGWLGTGLASLATSLILAMPFASARADEATWLRKGSTICQSVEDLAAAKEGRQAHCIAAPMSIPAQAVERVAGATRFKLLGVGNSAEVWADPNSSETDPTPDEMSPD